MDADDHYCLPYEFLCDYCMTHPAFKCLLKLIEDDPIFKKKPGCDYSRANHEPVCGSFLHVPAFSLLVFLKFAGCYGNGGSMVSVGKHFGIARGTVRNYYKKGRDAILKLWDQVICWLGKGKGMKYLQQ